MESKTVKFYCKKCRKSLGVEYETTGDNAAPIMPGVILKCRTNKCTRTLTFKNIKEGDILARIDKDGRIYI